MDFESLYTGQIKPAVSNMLDSLGSSNQEYDCKRFTMDMLDTAYMDVVNGLAVDAGKAKFRGYDSSGDDDRRRVVNAVEAEKAADDYRKMPMTVLESYYASDRTLISESLEEQGKAAISSISAEDRKLAAGAGRHVLQEILELSASGREVTAKSISDSLKEKGNVEAAAETGRVLQIIGDERVAALGDASRLSASFEKDRKLHDAEVFGKVMSSNAYASDDKAREAAKQIHARLLNGEKLDDIRENLVEAMSAEWKMSQEQAKSHCDTAIALFDKAMEEVGTAAINSSAVLQMSQKKAANKAWLLEQQSKMEMQSDAVSVERDSVFDAAISSFDVGDESNALDREVAEAVYEEHIPYDRLEGEDKEKIVVELQGKVIERLIDSGGIKDDKDFEKVKELVVAKVENRAQYEEGMGKLFAGEILSEFAKTGLSPEDIVGMKDKLIEFMEKPGADETAMTVLLTEKCPVPDAQALVSAMNDAGEEIRASIGSERIGEVIGNAITGLGNAGAFAAAGRVDAQAAAIDAMARMGEEMQDPIRDLYIETVRSAVSSGNDVIYDEEAYEKSAIDTVSRYMAMNPDGDKDKALEHARKAAGEYASVLKDERMMREVDPAGELVSPTAYSAIPNPVVHQSIDNYIANGGEFASERKKECMDVFAEELRKIGDSGVLFANMDAKSKEKAGRAVRGIAHFVETGYSKEIEKARVKWDAMTPEERAANPSADPKRLEEKNMLSSAAVVPIMRKALSKAGFADNLAMAASEDLYRKGTTATAAYLKEKHSADGTWGENAAGKAAGNGGGAAGGKTSAQAGHEAGNAAGKAAGNGANGGKTTPAEGTANRKGTGESTGRGAGGDAGKHMGSQGTAGR